MDDLPTHYQGSRGATEIATMPHSYLLNAHDKLVRDGDPARRPEILAMARQITRNNEAYAEAEAAKAQMEQGA
ncbi:MAG: hypothetical protein J7521_20180 [Caulobacter sp.]|nr:hypothetical protein [Caulobacter sp.]